MTRMEAVLAHQGGWDEALVLLGLLVALYAIGWLARVRAARRRDPEDRQEPRLDHRTRLEQRRRIDEQGRRRRKKR